MAAALSTTTSNYRVDLLNQAIEQLEDTKELQGCTVKFDTCCADHVHLFLENRNIHTYIGIIFPIIETQYGKVEKTVDEIAQAILQALNIHEEVKDRPDFILNRNGVPFYIGNLNIEINNKGFLVIDGTIVTNTEEDGTKQKVCAGCFLYEKGVYFEESETGYKISECDFIELDDGHYEVSPCQDLGPHKMLINNEKEVVRSLGLNNLLRKAVQEAAEIDPKIFQEYKIAYKIDKNTDLVQLAIKPIQSENIFPIGAITTPKIAPDGTVKKTVREVALEILRVFKEHQNKE